MLIRKLQVNKEGLTTENAAREEEKPLKQKGKGKKKLELRTDPDQEIKRYESAMATHAEHVSRLKSDLAAIEVQLQAVATDAGLVTEKI